MSMAMMCFALVMMFNQIYHSTLLASEAYSSPSIIMSHGKGDNRIIVDDYREAYYWLKQNTAQDARILSWWDYGYQITGMANRTVLVDNNTWNNTHIATVGKALASTEKGGYDVARFMGADYVLVIFGGMTNFSGDDIAKFMWMIRIAAAEFPQVKEDHFYNKQGSYRIDSTVSDTMKNCLMYKLIYYRFGEVKIKRDEDKGYDSTRKAVIGHKDFKLDYFEEAFTSERWLVRIYRVLPPEAMDPEMQPRYKRPEPTTPADADLMKYPGI